MDDLSVSRFTEIDPVILVLVECFGTAHPQLWYVWWFTVCYFCVHHPLSHDTLHNHFLSLPFDLMFIITFFFSFFFLYNYLSTVILYSDCMIIFNGRMVLMTLL